MKAYTSHSLEETSDIAKEWLRSISDAASGSDEATFIGLSGHLGAGKTAFVKAVAKELGVTEQVTSPTFVIMKIYETNNQDPRDNNQWPWKRLVHIDVYRLEKPEEIQVLDLEALLADKNNLIMIEWPENVGLDKNPELQMLRFEIHGGVYCITGF